MPIYRHFAVPLFASCDAFETFSDWTLSRIFPCYFSKAPPYWRRQKMNPNIRKIDILCNVTNKKFARHFENHRCMTWRHTGSDQWTNVYPRDGPSLLAKSLYQFQWWEDLWEVLEDLFSESMLEDCPFLKHSHRDSENQANQFFAVILLSFTYGTCIQYSRSSRKRLHGWSLTGAPETYQ